MSLCQRPSAEGASVATYVSYHDVPVSFLLFQFSFFFSVKFQCFLSLRLRALSLTEATFFFSLLAAEDQGAGVE